MHTQTQTHVFSLSLCLFFVPLTVLRTVMTGTNQPWSWSHANARITITSSDPVCTPAASSCREKGRMVGGKGIAHMCVCACVCVCVLVKETGCAITFVLSNTVDPAKARPITSATCTSKPYQEANTHTHNTASCEWRKTWRQGLSFWHAHT